MRKSPARILVVEDDPGIAVLQRRRLERSGFEIHVASDVDSALSILAKGALDLVLMDYRLGATTGLDLHGRMKAAGFDVPVVILSGSMDDQVVIDAIRAGVRDVIVKSTDYLDYLPETVRGVLSQATSVADRRPHEHDTRTILIVEDDAAMAALERRHIERAGYVVAVAGTADEALDVLASKPVSLAVLDLRLPGGVSGIELYERMKSAGWNIPAILVTAYPDQTVAIGALRAGIRDFVPKSPDFLDYLPAAVDRIVTQVRVERKLIESELRLASIIGTTMDAILMCDERRQILLFNRSAEELFQCAASDALKAPIDRFIPDLEFGPLDETPPRSSGTLRQRVEVEAVLGGGERIPLEVSVSDVVVHGKRLFTVIARDVSERRRIEAELREADRRKDEFLGMLAHELRNPLAAITGAGEVLHQIVDDARAQKVTNVIRRQSRALARMVDDLLDVSRVTLGKIQMTMEPLVLQQVVTRVADSMRDEIAHADIEFAFGVDAEPLWVQGDATRLEQVLTNLMNNAVKFTPAGGRITLEARREADAAVVRVRDTGIGMDRTLVPRVFDLFVQGDTSLARSKSGLGIGLALVRQVVALHGGQVTAASDGPDRGSEFVVRLPAAPEETLLQPQEAVAVTVDQRMRVLVVDDQPDVADAVALLIEMLGHDARAAYDGRAALEASRSNPPDVMFVDVGMPGMTGYELAGHVRLDQHLSHVRLVALTGYGREEDRARAMEAGFDLHVTKPVVDTTLQEVFASLRGGTSA